MAGGRSQGRRTRGRGGRALGAGPGDEAAGPTEVEQLPVAAEYCRDDLGVAGDAADGVGSERRAVVEQARAGASGEVVVVDGDDELRAVAAVVGQFARGENAAADLGEGVGASLTCGAHVMGLFGRVVPGGA
ncbi:hypothetical protein Cci01nite_44410 [Catellatospora citrea]|uniref:Uncharacterized protein n=1 Tax=Catellatospora citrea TaxID=53366 RepID=A0A8J3KAC8_9ACTN|nr:hypothetical protein Cci01nite_44410 [Catellatospora citrea]